MTNAYGRRCALLLDEDDHVLLVHFDWAGLVLAGGFWARPGGIDPGESTRLFSTSHQEGQTDVTCLVRDPRFALQPGVELRAQNVHGLRWLSPSEVAAGVVTFSPEDLNVLLSHASENVVPDRPREMAAIA